LAQAVFAQGLIHSHLRRGMRTAVPGSMKLALAFTASTVAVHAIQLQRHAIRSAAEGTPMEQVVELLSGLKTRIEDDSKIEQASYDKYACWCSDTIDRKTTKIATDKARVEELSNDIVRLGEEMASHGAQIEQLDKDIKSNEESQEEAGAVRDTERGDYNSERTESEQCIGALEAAVKTLTGAGEAPATSLTAIRQAELLSVVAGVRGVLQSKRSAVGGLSDTDRRAVGMFVDDPEAMFAPKGASSSLQVRHNPFGDYAPASTQIQGILQGMYATFAKDLESDNAGESNKQKNHVALMATKAQELASLKDSLATHQGDQASKEVLHAENKKERSETVVLLQDTEQFLETARQGCKNKAMQWNERSRLRSMELAGIIKASEILTTGSAVFENSTKVDAFVQLSAVKSGVRAGASGHFDKVVVMIDKMIKTVREEGEDDVRHKDRCENAENKNQNNLNEVEAQDGKADAKISAAIRRESTLDTLIQADTKSIEALHTEIGEQTTQRVDDEVAFKKSVRDDTAAKQLLNDALQALLRFSQENNIALSMVQGQRQAPPPPAYTIDEDEAPETSWEGGAYGGRKSESTGIVAIMKMLIEDVSGEIATARKEEAQAKAAFEKEVVELKKTLKAQEKLKLNKEAKRNALFGETHGLVQQKVLLDEAMKEEQAMQTVLGTDCGWVATHFESRREERKNELEGLQKAKAVLAGGGDAD